MPEQNSTKTYYHIAFAADRNFSVPLGLACLSLLRNAAKSSRYHIHVLGDDIEEGVRDELLAHCEAGGHKLSYHDVSQALRGVWKTDYFPSVAFGRFLLPDLLPEDVEKAIYLDADVMICQDLAPLYEMDMGDALLAAVPESTPASNDKFSADREKWAAYFKLDMNEALYCNSGVLVFNMPLWRAEKPHVQMLHDAVERGHDFIYPDQDLMNGLWQGRFVQLPTKYCFVPHLYRYYTALAEETVSHPLIPVTKEELSEAATAPAIMHFVSSSKPFVLMPPRCGYEQFYELWRSSPWKHRIPYLPHRMHQGIRVSNSLFMKLVLLDMVVATYIPFYYPLLWKLTACLPESLLKRIARFFNWTYPEK